jgi:hypothetical protein
MSVQRNDCFLSISLDTTSFLEDIMPFYTLNLYVLIYIGDEEVYRILFQKHESNDNYKNA